ncbi:MAG: PorT family protein [Chlorobi bacterium]|nr:PorT family protein [Chlorobiota bacterium]MCI0716606.1 PorT family protein [Chlorobiota bacterium]
MKVFIFLFLLNTLFSINSQIINEYGVKVGLNSAYQSSYIETDEDSYPIDNSENRLGYNIGIFASVINSNYFNLLIEPRITQKGFTTFFSTYFENYGNVSPSLTYFSISLLGKPKLTAKFITGYLLLGTSMNWLIARKEDIFNGIFKNVRTNTISLDVGAGIQKTLSQKITISFEFKYDYEMHSSPIHDFKYNGDLYTFEYGQSFRNKTFEFILGIGFR